MGRHFKPFLSTKDSDNIAVEYILFRHNYNPPEPPRKADNPLESLRKTERFQPVMQKIKTNNDARLVNPAQSSTYTENLEYTAAAKPDKTQMASASLALVTVAAFIGVLIVGLAYDYSMDRPKPRNLTVMGTTSTQSSLAPRSNWLFEELRMRNFKNIHEVEVDDSSKEAIRTVLASVSECRVTIKFNEETKVMSLVLPSGSHIDNPTAFTVYANDEFADCIVPLPAPIGEEPSATLQHTPPPRQNRTI